MATAHIIANAYTRSNTSYTQVTNESNMYNPVSNTSSYATLRGRNRNSSTAYYIFIRDFQFGSLPEGAIVNSFSVKIRCYRSSNQRTGTNFYLRLTSGATSGTVISNTTTSTNIGTSASTITIPTGSLTWNQIVNYGSNFSIEVPLASNSSSYPYVYVYGAEIEVDYTLPVTYNITINNSTSATVSANPTSVLEGNSTTITADTISGLTITDNNTNVTSQFTQHSGTTGEYTMETRGSYGFTLNSNGYYESQNKGVNTSCAVARISFSLPVAATITFQYINYAEATYDFGVFGNVDVALTTNYYPAGSGGATISETSYKKACNTSSDNTSSVQTLTYSNVAAGDHFIDVKFSKDDGTGSNNDTLQFKVTITYNSSVTYYTYTINNVTADHTIVVTQSGSGPKFYVKINGTWTQVSKIYKKVNGSWVEQTSSNWSTLFSTSTNYRKMN